MQENGKYQNWVTVTLFGQGENYKEGETQGT